jgi:hypothetical protein
VLRLPVLRLDERLLVGRPEKTQGTAPGFG